jgi:uncharacterized membrane protein
MLRTSSAVVVILALAVAVSPAVAATTAVTVDNAEPTLTDAGDKGFTASLGFTNLTDQRVTLEAAASDDDTCDLTLDKPALDGGHHQTVTLTIPPACEVAEEGGFDFEVRSVSGAEPPVSLELSAAPKPDKKPNWEPLLAFPLAMLLMLVLVTAVFRAWLGDVESRNWDMELEHLDPGWSFKDSWATNVTAGAAVVSAVFASSEVLTALLGKDAKEAMGLAIVGGAIALAFAGAGPLVVAASRREATGRITARGLVLAAAVTLTGAYGQIWVLLQFARDLDLGGADAWAYVAAILGALLLLWYAVRGLRIVLTAGTTAPTDERVAVLAESGAIAVSARRRAAVL